MKPLVLPLAALLLLASAAATACTPLTVDTGAIPGQPPDPDRQALNRTLLALAQSRGDPLSDLLLAKATCQPVGTVGEWPLRSVPASTRADVDADAMASIALHDAEFQGLSAPLQRQLEAQLLAAAENNAYFAASLLDPAADTGNDALLDAALKAGAAAPRYASPFVPALDSALARFEASGLEDRTGPGPDGRALRRRDDVSAAVAIAVGALPGVTGFVVACRQPTPARRADCIRLAQHMLAGATTRLEANTAAGILDALAAADGAEPAWRHRGPVLWLQRKPAPIAVRIAALPDTDAARHVDELRSQGELVVLRAMLARDGVPATPPPGWTP